jgi:phenylpropionate dioxygenase-like ring-hydroxylating dioxygenase large terminal subunit
MTIAPVEPGNQSRCPYGRPADAVALNAWYVIAAMSDLQLGEVRHATLLDTRLAIRCTPAGEVEVVSVQSPAGPCLPLRQKFGYVWTTLGTPTRDIFEIPQYHEPKRRNIHAGSVTVQVSAPRAIENFLDLAHFAFVHTNYLGEEPHTEVKPYEVNISEDGEEILATQCRAYQPLATLKATQGYEVEYVYRVPHAYCALLYKAVTADPTRQDVIGLFLQPASEERVIAHMMLSLLDDANSDAALRAYQRLIFSQDKPILENQLPKRLPLDVRSEISARADASSATYRRWLKQRGVRFGTVACD